MVKKILVGLGDLQFSRSATQHAIELAKLHGAELTAVTLMDPSRLLPGPVPIGAGDAAKALLEYRLQLTTEIVDQSTREFEATVSQAGLSYAILPEKGNPFERMISCARYHDLIICGLRNLFDHGVMREPPAELAQLVESGVRPLLAVMPVYRKIERVLIAYSGSQESAKTMKRFVQLDLWPDLSVRIVTFDRDEKARQRLAAAAEYCRAHGWDPETDVVDESPKDHLLPYAQGQDADLIVMGNSAKRFLIRRIFGETALHVMAHADRPLFLCQ